MKSGTRYKLAWQIITIANAHQGNTKNSSRKEILQRFMIFTQFIIVVKWISKHLLFTD